MRRHPSALLAAIPDLLFELADDGTICDYHSPRTELLLMPPERFMGKNVQAVLPPEAAGVCMAALDECRAAGYSNGRTYSLDLESGRRWFELAVSGIPAHEADTQPRYIVLVRDVTARHLAEEANRIAAVAFEAQTGMMVTDAHNVIIKVNQAFTKITGFDAADVVGGKPSVLSSGRHERDFYRDMWTTIAETGSWHGEIWNRRKNGQEYPEWLSISAVRDPAGAVTHYVASFRDSSLQKVAEQQIENLAFFDALTGLPNRRHFVVDVQKAMAYAASEQSLGAVLMIELEDFKVLNDALGHSRGDFLLQQVAKRLGTCIKPDWSLAKVGGDEFGVLVGGLHADPAQAAQEAAQAASRILRVLMQPHFLTEASHVISSNIGIAVFSPDQQHDIEDLLKHAEMAMREAKNAGRNEIRVYDPKMHQDLSERIAMEADLRQALQKGEFHLVYQPQVNARGALIGVEALLRWRQPVRGLVPPPAFIPVAEESGLILPLGKWILQTACQQICQWSADPALAHVTVAVNVSAMQFHQDAFVDDVLDALARTGANPALLKVELTESLMVSDVHTIIAKMTQLQARGIAFSMDDFGTGYSSLSQLKRLPLQQLKIDQSFVRNILTDANDAAISKMVIALAHSMELDVIAEGVEYAEQAQALENWGCHAFQGYLFGKPMPAYELLELAHRLATEQSAA